VKTTLEATSVRSDGNRMGSTRVCFRPSIDNRQPSALLDVPLVERALLTPATHCADDEVSLPEDLGIRSRYNIPSFRMGVDCLDVRQLRLDEF
jgi:hypothetical protein